MTINRFYRNGLEFISVRNNNNFVVTFSPLGASIFSIELDDKFLTQTPSDVELFKDRRLYHGKTIGRVSNRIENATFSIGRKVYHSQKNDVDNTLHGGYEGFSNQFFSFDIASNNDETKIIFTYFSSDMEAGFPGNLEVKVIYTVFEHNNSLTVDYSANTDKDTLIGLTNHTYFHLGSKSVDELSLYINANKFIHPRRTDLVPMEYRPVDKVMDFQTTKKVTQDIEDKYLDDSWTYGYDHHYCFNEVDPTIRQVVLENNEYKLDIYTNFNGVQIYTDNYPDGVEYEDVTATRRRSVAIEPQDDLLKRVVLKKKETYTRFIRYDFIRK